MLGLEWWVVVSGILALTLVAAYAGPGVFMYTWRRRGIDVLQEAEENVEHRIKTAAIRGYQLRMKHEKSKAHEDEDDDYH